MFEPNDVLTDLVRLKLDVSSEGLLNGLLGFAGGLLPDETKALLTIAVLTQNIDSIAEILSSFLEYPVDILKNLLLQANIFSLDNLGNPLDSILNFIGNLPTPNEAINAILDSLGFGSDGGIGILNEIIEKAGGQATPATIAQGLAVRPIPANVLSLFNDKMVERDYKSASELINPFLAVGTPISATQAILEKITVTAAGTIVIDASSLVLAPQPVITPEFVQPKKFSYVTSREELESEMRRCIEREICEVVVHWTETYINANLSAEDIEDINKAFGYNNIVYHYVIKRDGSLQRGLDIAVPGEHCPLLNHDKHSIGIVFVGGLNMATTSTCFEDIASAAGLTRAQINTFDSFLRAFYDNYPGGQVLGHRDIDISQDDPGFDVIDYCESVFNKRSLYLDPTSETALGPEDIVKKQLTTNYNVQYDLIRKG